MTLRPIREEHEYSWRQAESLACETLEPVLFRQVFREWTPVRTWNEEYLLARIGHQHVQVDISNNAEFPSLEVTDREDATLSIRELLSRLHQSHPPYYFLNSGAAFFNLGALPNTLDALRDDIRMSAEQQPGLLVKSLLWMSASGVLSRLHFDGNACHNLNVQVSGRKEFILLAPGDAPSLQLVDDPLQRHFGHFSRLAGVAKTPDISLPQHLNRWHVTLEPGDALLIPALWLHAVCSLDPLNINVNYWSIAGQGYLGRLLTTLSR